MGSQLARLDRRDESRSTWEGGRRHLTDHASEGISTDAGGFNPFRPAFRELLPKENFLESLMRVFDAPFVAALAAMGRITLDKVQILTVKDVRSEEHTSELQSLMRISYAVFCLKKKTYTITQYRAISTNDKQS